MQHSFDIDIAKEYGILEAILLNNIWFWIEKNKANNTNFYDGAYWTYNSTRAFNELFPYVSQRQIQIALKKLIEEGILQTGNYNKVAYDRTLWYAFTEKGKCIMQKCKMDDSLMLNGSNDDVPPIPDNKPNEKPNIKPNKFIKPSLEEVRKYCLERNNNIDAEQFIDYYDSNGWKVGKNSMKDWKAAIRTWEKRDNSKQTRKELIPDWLNKDIEVESDPEKEKEMAKMLKGLDSDLEERKAALIERLKK